MTVQQVILQHILNAPPVTTAPSLHVAIITDGNGRWATSRGLPRSAGHRAGAEASRAIIEAAPKLGIHTLTLFALSSANWSRPAGEVNAILRLLHEYLMAETSRCMENGIRVSHFGPARPHPRHVAAGDPRFRGGDRERRPPPSAPRD